MRFCLGSSRRACFLITTIAASANASPISRAASAAAEYSSAITELGQLPQLRPDYPRPTTPTFSFIFNTPQVLIRSFIPQTSIRMANSTQQPFNVYWRRFTNSGERVPLSFLERLFAYGVKVDSPCPRIMRSRRISCPTRRGSSTSISMISKNRAPR